MPVTILIHEIGNLLFPKLCQHIRHRPTHQSIRPVVGVENVTMVESNVQCRAVARKFKRAVLKYEIFPRVAKTLYSYVCCMHSPYS